VGALRQACGRPPPLPTAPRWCWRGC